MREAVRRYGYFVLVVAAIVGVLLTLNRLPLLLQQGTLRTYPTVEAVRTKLNIRDLRIPTYFPQDVIWPPNEIWAQTRPYVAVLMVFRHSNASGPVLIVSQTATGHASLDERIRLLQTTESVPYVLKGRKAHLFVGVCDGNEVCSRIVWNEDKSAISVAMRSAPFELIRIAESMVQ